MHAEFSDADDDIDSVEWFSHLSNAHPDEVTGADRSRVTLSAPGEASHTRAKVRVMDARGNEAERSCAVELDPGPPLPRISEGERGGRRGARVHGHARPRAGRGA